MRESIDPHVQDNWIEAFGRPPKFGDLRKSWRTEHCATINPYGSEHCPFTPWDCALAFYTAVNVTTMKCSKPASAGGYFRKVAKSMALIRADNHPLSRDRREEGPGLAGTLAGSGHTGLDRSASPGSGGDVQPVRGRLSRPDRVADVLRSFNLGPRQGPADDGEESAERSSTSGDPMLPPSS